MPATILIVEDHDEVRTSLRDWLKIGFPHCRVIEAASGEEAIALVRTESSNIVVVMDITLPGMNGIEAARQIKAILPSSQIAMLTIHDDSTHRTYAKAAGASAYVPKRAMQAELVSTLAALLVNGRD